MAYGIKTFSFIPGKWTWDNENNGLVFVCDDEKPTHRRTSFAVSATSATERFDLKFRDDFSQADYIIFQRYYRRRCKLKEREIVILQDIKDSVLYTINADQLDLYFIEFIHTPTADRLLRALIVYFQFYLKVWNQIRRNRHDAKTMLMHPTVKEDEFRLNRDLCDLRAIVGREYLSILTGEEEMYKYYHMANKINFSNAQKDTRLHEMLIKVSCRIVWTALLRPPFLIIEREMNRIMRTDRISDLMCKRNYGVTFTFFMKERKFLRENPRYRDCFGCKHCNKCVQCKQSPLYNELILTDHDPRLLSIGLRHFEPTDERIEFLEKMYLLPEEKLTENGICVGILGMPRSKFDFMLKYIHQKGPDETFLPRPDLSFNIPPATTSAHQVIHTNFYPREEPKIKPVNREELIRKQCNVWKKRAMRAGSSEEPKLSVLNSKSTLNLF